MDERLQAWRETHPALRKIVIAALQKQIAEYHFEHARQDAESFAMMSAMTGLAARVAPGQAEGMAAGAGAGLQAMAEAKNAITAAFHRAYAVLEIPEDGE